MISNELLKKKILDEAIHGRLIENDLSLSPVNVEEIKEDIPFEIPNNWRCCCLGCVATCKTGNSINEKEKKDKFSDMFVEGLHYVATKDISTNSIINYENGIKIPHNLVEKFKIAEKDSILLCIEGGSAGKKIGFTTKDICFVNKLCNISSKVINNKFIYYFIQTNFFYKQFESKKTGIIGGVSIKNIEKLIIFVPPLEEQEKIVKKIEELFELIDKKEKNDKEKEKLKTLLKEKILDSAIHGELVKNDLSLPTVDVEEIKEDIPFEIPNNWKWVTVLKVCDIVMGQSPNGESINNINGIEFHQGKKLFGKKFLLVSSEFTTIPTKIIEPNTIVMSVRAPVGDINITPRRICIGRGLCSFSPNSYLNNMFLYYLLKFNYEDINSMSKGTTFVSITSKDIKKINFPIPPLEQQKKIVEKIEKCFELIEQL